MKRLLCISLSSFIACTAFTPVQAETYTKRQYLNKDTCYTARRVPATIEYDTRGIKLRDSSRSWEGNMQKSGAKIRDRYHDPVFVQTKRVVEDQHVTLIPSPC